MRQSNNKQARPSNSPAALTAAVGPTTAQRGGPKLQSKEARNKANTIRNSVKVEHYLMEVEKSQGFAKSWALRERLEQGQVSLDDLIRR